MKKQLKELNPGTIFSFGQEKFVVLEQMEDGVFCLLEQSTESVPFHNGNDDPLNDYSKSSLRNEIESNWLSKLIDNGAKYSDMVEFEVDLRPTDQSEGYDSIKVYAAPLTLWQYGKYKDIIPLNEDDWWWLVTPLWTRWLRSPYTSNTGSAWLVITSGSYSSNSCSISYGVRPSLKLHSCLLVSVDGENEDTDCRCDQCDNYSVDLSRVNTLDLLKEVEKRLSEETACCEEDDEE